jgi:DnaA family protein
MRQLALDISPRPRRSFDEFVTGSNDQVVQWLRSAALVTTPVFLWGPSGTGKTHLLHAAAARREELGGRVGWFDAGAALPWRFDPTWALVVLDDCDHLDAERQQAAFALFVEAVDYAVPWLAAGRLPPVDLPVRDDLRTRLAWGQVFAVQPLSEHETRAALRREADRRGIFLSDPVMAYVLSRYQRDLKHLMALLDRLDDFALAEHRPVTVPLLRRLDAEREITS